MNAKKRFGLPITILVFLTLHSPSLAAQGSYIKEFLICGSFPNPDQQTRLSKDYLNSESKVIPQVGLVSAGRRWVKYTAKQQSLNFLDPSLNFAQRENAVAYAHIYVKSPRERSAFLLVGSDDAVAVWVNGVKVHFNDRLRSLRLDQDVVPVKLAAGWNRILFKVANGAVDWALSARFRKDKDLVIQADNPVAEGKFETPHTSAELLVKNVNVPPYMRISKDGHPYQIVKASIFNIGTEAAKKVYLRVVASDNKVLAERTIAEIGGRQTDLSFKIPLQAMLNLPPKGVPIEIKATHAGKTVGAPAVLATGRRFLENFFSYYYLSDWETSSKTEGGKTEITFARTFEVPPEFSGFGISIAVDIGRAVGQVLVNGSVKRSDFSGKSGDIQLIEQARKGEKFFIQVKVRPFQGRPPRLAESFLRVSYTPVETYLKNASFASSLFNAQISDDKKIVAEIIKSLRSKDTTRLQRSVAAADKAISKVATEAKSYTVHLIGNAHIDLAWLWRYPETIQVCRNTFRAAINNMKSFPNFTYSQSQAQAYLWMEENDPELFKEIQKYAKEGRWEVVGGSWSEADGNMPSGEGFVREYLYGKRYFKEKLGVDVKVGWMPDTFGHQWNMPQVLKKSGIDYYVFCRAGKGQRIFWWEGLDGTRILAYQPPAWYNSRVDRTIANNALEMDKRYGIKDVMRLYGVGDHGGGPTLRDIKQAQEFNKLNAFPNVKFSTAHEFFAKVSAAEKNKAKKIKYPVINDELNFTFRGCYTSQAGQKRNNRRAENLLATAETFSTLAMSFGFGYPQREFVTAWRNVGFNHFHDLLSGSGIGAIYQDAQKIYNEVFQTAEAAISDALKVIASKIDTRLKDTADAMPDAVPIIVFNRLGWDVTDVVEVGVNVAWKPSETVIVDGHLKALPTQVINAEGKGVRIAFLAKDIPSVGYRVYWALAKHHLQGNAEVPPSGLKADRTTLENQALRVTIDPQSGCITSIFDKRFNKELISKGAKANRLQILGDSANAWGIRYTGQVHDLDRGAKVELIESGPVRGRVRVSYNYGNSSLTQDIILADRLPRLDVAARIDWHEHNKLIKIAFPLDIQRGKATFEIPFGAISRPTDGQEYPMQKWFDLTHYATPEMDNPLHGVTILNDCKYGCDVNKNIMRLTALRSPTDPDRNADQGLHIFSYAVYPHKGDWREGESVRRGYEFNNRLFVITDKQHGGQLPSGHSFIKIEQSNIILTACKKSEDDNEMVLRFYEAHGKPIKARITFDRPIKEVSEVNLIEWDEQKLDLRGLLDKSGRTVRIDIRGYEVKTIKVQLSR